MLNKSRHVWQCHFASDSSNSVLTRIQIFNENQCCDIVLLFINIDSRFHCVILSILIKSSSYLDSCRRMNLKIYCELFGTLFGIIRTKIEMIEGVILVPPIILSIKMSLKQILRIFNTIIWCGEQNLHIENQLYWFRWLEK